MVAGRGGSARGKGSASSRDSDLDLETAKFPGRASELFRPVFVTLRVGSAIFSGGRLCSGCGVSLFHGRQTQLRLGI